MLTPPRRLTGTWYGPAPITVRSREPVLTHA
jgi:hypothetical protein